MNLASIILLIIIIICFALALIYSLKHKGGCCGDCKNCANRCRHPNKD